VTNDDTFAQSNCWNYNDQHYSSRKLVSKSESFMCSVYHVFQYRHDLVFHINLWFLCRSKTGMISD
jgi:hypothetical protein